MPVVLAGSVNLDRIVQARAVLAEVHPLDDTHLVSFDEVVRDDRTDAVSKLCETTVRTPS